MMKRSLLPSLPLPLVLAAAALAPLRAADANAQSPGSHQILSAISASPLATPIPHRFLVTLAQSSTGAYTAHSEIATLPPGSRLVQVNPRFGMAVVQSDPSIDDATEAAQLGAQPGVVSVVHDYVVSAQALRIRPVPAIIGVSVGAPIPYDTYYESSPYNWAVRQSGGYGLGIEGGSARGPWNTTLGAGVRIAILDSGVDPTHPDIAPNLVLNLSEIDQSETTGIPSECDDGSPVDQQGHGTWTASLAAAAMGPGTGQTVGVAPQASILNIKVLERLPDDSSTAPDTATRCHTGEASGMLSWIIQGIEDAVANKADVISMSLGALIDLQSGEGAGLQVAFDRVTHAAFASGAVLVASAGNDGLDLSNPRYMVLPAQSRDVLAVVGSTNPDCAENLEPGAQCAPGPVTLPYYSNFGGPLNAVAAPGGSYPDLNKHSAPGSATGWILGACASGLSNTDDGPPSDAYHSFGCFDLGHTPYVSAIGTSASAPLAAGAAALLRAANPGWTPDQIVSALRSRAVALSSLPAAPELNPNVLP